MRVVFLSKKLSSTSVVDPTGTLLFQITTPATKKRKTTMYDPQGNAIGIFRRRLWTSDKIVFRGQTRRLSEWMPKKRWSSHSSRKLSAPDGRSYTWKKKYWRHSFQLIDSLTKRVVATVHRKRLSTCGLISKRRMVIDLSPGVAHMVDAVVFSFVVWDRLRGQAAASAASIAAAA